MNVHDYLEKIATDDYFFSQVKRQDPGVSSPRFKDGSNLQDVYRSMQKSPEGMAQARAVRTMTGGDLGLLKGTDYSTKTKGLGSRVSTSQYEGVRTRPKFFMSTKHGDTVFRHELGHLVDFKKRKHTIDDKNITYPRKEESTVKALRERLGKAPLSPDKLRRMEALKSHRDKLLDEKEANRRAIASYVGKRSVKDLSPTDRKKVTFLLANMGQYYEAGEEMGPIKGFRRHKKALEDAKLTPKLREKLEKLDNPEFAELDTFRGDSQRQMRAEDINSRTWDRKSNLRESIIDHRNPFTSKGVWKSMSKDSRKKYIQQIKTNRDLIRSDFGKQYAELYMSEMMKGLRATLRK